MIYSVKFGKGFKVISALRLCAIEHTARHSCIEHCVSRLSAKAFALFHFNCEGISQRMFSLIEYNFYSHIGRFMEFIYRAEWIRFSRFRAFLFLHNALVVSLSYFRNFFLAFNGWLTTRHLFLLLACCCPKLVNAFWHRTNWLFGFDWGNETALVLHL